MTEAGKHRRCKDCKKKSPLQWRGYRCFPFMLQHELWHSLTVGGRYSSESYCDLSYDWGLLCLRCCRKKMDRPLERADFLDKPFPYRDKLGMSPFDYISMLVEYGNGDQPDDPNL